MATSRKQRIRELQAAESRLDTQWQQLQANGEGRVAYLRAAHPGWLVGGGFLTGFIVDRVFSASVRNPRASRVLRHGVRLWPLLPHNILRAVFAGGSPLP